MSLRWTIVSFGVIIGSISGLIDSALRHSLSYLILFGFLSVVYLIIFSHEYMMLKQELMWPIEQGIILQKVTVEPVSKEVQED